jgi:hypothetical protein
MMSDLEYIAWITGTIVFFGIASAILEWNDRTPPSWVVKAWIWLNRRNK